RPRSRGLAGEEEGRSRDRAWASVGGAEPRAVRCNEWSVVASKSRGALPRRARAASDHPSPGRGRRVDGYFGAAAVDAARSLCGRPAVAASRVADSVWGLRPVARAGARRRAAQAERELVEGAADGDGAAEPTVG